LLEVDGATVTQRAATGVSDPNEPFVITWLAAGLAPGAHQVRVLVAWHGGLFPAPPCDPSLCFGSAEADEKQARLTVIGFPPTP
jgi:hypothetical protein